MTTLRQDLNLGTEPFLPEINVFLDNNPRLSRALRLATWMALAEGSAKCEAISSHASCVASAMQRLTTLSVLASSNPDAIDCLMEATRSQAETLFPLIDFDEVLSDDDGRINR